MLSCFLWVELKDCLGDTWLYYSNGSIISSDALSLQRLLLYKKNLLSFLTSLSKRRCVTCGPWDNCALISTLPFLLFWSGTETVSIEAVKIINNCVSCVWSKLFEAQSSILKGMFSSWQWIFLPCSSSFSF